jgi:hypothetical protein
MLSNKKLQCYWQDKNKATLLLNFSWDGTLLDGDVKACMIEKVYKHIHSHVFTLAKILKAKILKAMGLGQFKLSLVGHEVLRCVNATNKYRQDFSKETQYFSE